MSALQTFMKNVTLFCFLASYVVALGLEMLRLVKRTSINRAFMLGFAAAGLVAHTMYLYVRSQRALLPPLLSSPHDWMLVLAWMVVLFYVVLTAVDRDLAIGYFVLPIALMLIASSAFMGEAPKEQLNARREWGMLHAGLLVFGIAGVLFGFVLSMMYLVQHRRLKQKHRMKNGLTLPNLESLARWNWWAVVLSVPLLTLGLATGVGLGWINSAAVERFTWADPVVIGNGIAWLVMVVFFAWLMTSSRPLGKQVAWLTLWAFGFLLFTLIGLQLLSGRGSLDSWHASNPATREMGFQPVSHLPRKTGFQPVTVHPLSSADISCPHEPQHVFADVKTVRQRLGPFQVVASRALNCDRNLERERNTVVGLCRQEMFALRVAIFHEHQDGLKARLTGRRSADISRPHEPQHVFADVKTVRQRLGPFQVVASRALNCDWSLERLRNTVVGLCGQEMSALRRPVPKTFKTG